jgi:putative transposase
MTKRLVRYQQSGGFHFVTFSCYHRLPYLRTAAARNLFERSLEAMRLRYDFVVCGYVVMPEHVHLLVGEPKNAFLSKAIQALKLSVSVQRKERPFWQARYYDFNVRNEDKRVEKLRYMHRNPVKRGLFEKPEQWAWSSFRHYSTGEEGTVEIESFWTAARREAFSKSQVSSAAADETWGTRDCLGAEADTCFHGASYNRLHESNCDGCCFVFGFLCWAFCPRADPSFQKRFG